MKGLSYLPGETMLLRLRKHWLILLRDTGATILGGILPILILSALTTAGYLPRELVPFIPVLQFLLALWLLVTWLTLVVMWTNYYLDVWIITTKRVVSIEQIDLFNRRITSWNIDDIREINIHVENIIQTFFGYGSIEIETAGGVDEHERIEGIPHPERVRDTLLMQRTIPRVSKSATAVSTVE